MWCLSELISGARLRALAGSVAAGVLLAGCGAAPEIHKSEKPLDKDTLMLLGKKGMTPASPIFVRIFKEESELEVWKARDDGRFYHFKTYPICNWSGELGPKFRQGDKQAPEGFYKISRTQLNPNSQFYLSFNLGFPNAYDKVHNRTGSALMVHGKCRSAGCYAMTDALIEEIYALARESLRGDQTSFEVHAFPFRMTEVNLARHREHPAHEFWKSLKPGYDHFELTRMTPAIAICQRRYHVNVEPVAFKGRVTADGRCPAFIRPKVEPFMPRSSEQIASRQIVVTGPRIRAMGLTNDEVGRAITNVERATSRTGTGLWSLPSRGNSGTTALGFQ